MEIYPLWQNKHTDRLLDEARRWKEMVNFEATDWSCITKNDVDDLDIDIVIDFVEKYQSIIDDRGRTDWVCKDIDLPD